MKHLRQIVQPIDEAVNTDSFKPQPKSEKEFASLHTVNKIADRNGNGDEYFNQTKVKTYTRKKLGVPPTKEDGNVHVDTPLQKGVKVVATEEVEPVEELSKPLIQRYLKGARKQIKNPDVPEATKDKRHDGHLTGTLKKYGSNGVKVKATEEVEPVEEISKETAKAASYALAKSSKDIRDSAKATDFATRGKAVKRANSANLAHRKSFGSKNVKVSASESIVAEITDKEWEDSAEDKRVDKKNGFKDGTPKDEKADKKMVKAINKAEKTVKESLANYITSKKYGKVEKVEEISTDLAKRYVRKAVKSHDSESEDHEHFSNSGQTHDAGVAKANVAKREKGIGLAHKKIRGSMDVKVLTKEEVSADPHQREPGTDSLVNNYKSVVPGQGGKSNVVPPLAKAEKKKVSVEEAVMLIKDITVQEVQIEEAKKVEEQPVIITEEAKPAPKKSMNDLTNSLMRGGF